MKPDSGVLLHLEQMLTAAEQAVLFIEDLNEVEFLEDDLRQKAVAMSLLIVGEAASRLLTQHREFIENHAEIAWNSMTGMRNRIAHGYYRLNFTVVWNTARDDLPDLVSKIKVIISGLEQSTFAEKPNPTPES